MDIKSSFVVAASVLAFALLGGRAHADPLIDFSTGSAGRGGTISYANPGLVPQGVTVNSSINPAAFPGFNFNSTNRFGAATAKAFS